MKPGVGDVAAISGAVLNAIDEIRCKSRAWRLASGNARGQLIRFAKLSKALALVIVLSVPFWSHAFAAGSSKGTVGTVIVENNTVFFHAGSHGGYGCQLCNDNGKNWGDWAFSLNRPDGMAWLSLLLMAKSQGYTIDVRGRGQVTFGRIARRSGGLGYRPDGRGALY